MALAAISLAAASIHFAVMGKHFAEYAAFGIFFSVVAWLQALWAVAVMVVPARPLLLAGLVGNALIVLVWVCSRTTGPPVGPTPGVAEPAAFVDIVSTLLEVAIVAEIAVLLLVRGRTARWLSGRMAWLGSLVLIMAVVPLTTWAIASSVGAGEEHGAAHAQEGDTATPTGRPGFARVDLGEDRIVQVIVDSFGTLAQVHLTFFEAGQQLDIQSVSMSGHSASGVDVGVPVVIFEPGHFAASTELEPGDWTFRIQGVASDGRVFDVSFPLTIE